jgi:hypothetical protein
MRRGLPGNQFPINHDMSIPIGCAAVVSAQPAQLIVDQEWHDPDPVSGSLLAVREAGHRASPNQRRSFRRLREPQRRHAMADGREGLARPMSCFDESDG